MSEITPDGVKCANCLFGEQEDRPMRYAGTGHWVHLRFQDCAELLNEALVEAKAELEAERGRSAALVAALQPFADFAAEVSHYHPSWQEGYAESYPRVKYREYRAIHAVLTEVKEAQDRRAGDGDIAEA